MGTAWDAIVAAKLRIGSISHWLMTPVRAIIRGLSVLVNLTPRQMQAFCTLAMIGGIIANSVWSHLYLREVKEAAEAGMAFESPYFAIAEDMIMYLAAMSLAFAFTMSMVAFGAEWFSIKAKDIEASAGKAGVKMPEPVSQAPLYHGSQIGTDLHYPTQHDPRYTVRVDDPDGGTL